MDNDRQKTTDNLLLWVAHAWSKSYLKVIYVVNDFMEHWSSRTFGLFTFFGLSQWVLPALESKLGYDVILILNHRLDFTSLYRHFGGLFGRMTNTLLRYSLWDPLRFEDGDSILSYVILTRWIFFCFKSTMTQSTKYLITLRFRYLTPLYACLVIIIGIIIYLLLLCCCFCHYYCDLSSPRDALHWSFFFFKFLFVDHGQYVYDCCNKTQWILV